MKKIIFIGADHAGFGLKEQLKKWLLDNEYIVNDKGAIKLIPNDDYPDYAEKVATEIQNNNNAFGILVCGSGAGVCIVANKFKKIRAVTSFTKKHAELTRAHNNSNILCLGEREISFTKARIIISTWLSTEFARGRHERRIKKISKIEQKTMKK